MIIWLFLVDFSHFFFIFLPPFYQIAYIDLFRFCLYRHIDMNHYAIIIFFGHSKQNIIIRSFLYILCMYNLILMDMRCFDIFCFSTKICFISQEYRCLFIALVHQQKKTGSRLLIYYLLNTAYSNLCLFLSLFSFLSKLSAYSSSFSSCHTADTGNPTTLL